MKARETAAYVAAGLIVTSLVSWAAIRSSGAPNVPVNVSRPKPVAASQNLEPVRRIGAAELRQQMDRGEVLVIDVRDSDSYLTSHIPGAWHIPLSYIASELPYLPRSKPIATYCT